MDEELNDNELEERLYAMLHHVDETQNNVNNANQDDALKIVESTPRSTVRRYWRTSGECQPHNSTHQKINTPKDPTATIVNKQTNTTTLKQSEPKQKTEKPETATTDLSIFQSNPQNLQSTIEILENDNENIVELETSDEDEVIEVALPPKPTITIESSDDEGVQVQSKSASPVKPKVKTNSPQTKSTSSNDREISASPVPSVVSSVSDEFIRGDCIALNISSRHQDNHSFDFSLHGSDLLGHSTPSKKKKKKKNRETSTPVSKEALNVSVTSVNADDLFATPKSKAKNKKQKNKSYNVFDKNVPSADVYDSDSNQSIIETNKSHSYVVSEKSLPNTDVYESDSNQSETSTINQKKQASNNISNVIPEKPVVTPTTGLMNWRTMSYENDTTATVIDLTDKNISSNNTIEEDFIIGNVTGFTESDDYGNDSIQQTDTPVLGSTKVPAILYDDLDFDNLKGKANVCTKRKYSLSTLRAEMEKFYNESWGGEDFNHMEIMKSMSRDKSLWVIDPKDRMPTPMKRKVTCNYCNRTGHRDDTCRLKPPVCHMCGSQGHYEPRCPSKICVNCGYPNHMYSTMCRNCSTWGRVVCTECGQRGHPSSHCPDVWRRYHNTIEEESRLEENHHMKKHFHMFCSGCTRRGHLVHTCRVTIPFSGLPINSPYVSVYRPIYLPRQDRTFQPDSTNVSTPFRNERNKRQSKSPTTHETHVNKKRNISASEDGRRFTKSPQQRSVSMSEDIDKTANAQDTEKAPDFIPIGSTNRDKKGQIIQDNEVSDTSDVVTSARIYVTTDIIDQLKTEEGRNWLKGTTEMHNVSVENTDITSFLSLVGKVADQEAFQAALRDWSKSKSVKEHHKSENEADVSQDTDNEQSFSENIPKNRNNVLRKLSKALDSLKEDLGDPKDIYKELNYLQNRHEQLLKQKVISPKQVSNNRNHIKDMLKKLNMVLLGQAGLGEGSQHLTELYTLQEKLTNLRHKNIPLDLRKEIGLHYHCIFTALPRDDYVDLLKTYYNPTQTPASFKKKKKIKLNPKVVGKNKITTIPLSPSKMYKNNRANIAENTGAHERRPVVERTVNKLVFYHKRLMNSRPTGKILKKTRLELVRKLHTHIASLFRTANASSKVMKKIKKVQEQAQLFLSNV